MNKNHVSPANKEPLGDELLSAYVDGELSDAELARVEQRLANDPEAVQLVEELRSLSQDLQSLPKQNLSEDLSVAIMQRAERAMLLGTSMSSSDDVNTLPSRESTSTRRWAWAAMVLAATLLLSVFLPEHKQGEQQVAQVGSEQQEKSGETTLREVPELRATEGANEAETDMASSDISSGDGGFGGGGRGLDAESAVAASAPRGLVTDGDDSKERSQQEQTEEFDASLLACTVHVTLGNDAATEEFEKKLLQNGINFREPQPQSSSERGESYARATAKLALTNKKALAEQLVLVEAPTEQIEGMLEDCYIDTFNCPTVRIDEQQTSEPTVRFQQWARSGKAPEQNKLSSSYKKKQLSKKITQGWATRIPAEQFQSQDSLERNLGEQKLERSRARISGLKKSDAADSIRVLFVLQQSTTPKEATPPDSTMKPSEK